MTIGGIVHHTITHGAEEVLHQEMQFQELHEVI